MPRCFRSRDQGGGGWSVSLQRFGNAFGKIAVMVPVAVIELDEAHAALGQPPRQQAVVGEGAGLRAHRGRTARERCAGSFERSVSSGTDDLHAERHLVLRDARRRSSGSPNSSSVCSLSFAQRVQVARGAVRRGEARRVRQVQHRVADRAELHALETRGQEAAAPQAVVERLPAAALPGRDHDHERGQVLRVAAQAIGDPRRPCWAARRSAIRSGRT